jgi:hypothetical protein
MVFLKFVRVPVIVAATMQKFQKVSQYPMATVEV